MRNKKKLLAGIAAIALTLFWTGAANAALPTDSLPDEAALYLPETMLHDIERMEHKGDFSLVENSYYIFFRRFNLLNPTPGGALSSGADVGLNLFFDYWDMKDRAEKLREERYKLAKVRWGYRTFAQLFPEYPEVDAEKNMARLSERIAEIDKAMQKNSGDVVIIPEEKRPEPKSWKWIIAGDDWWKDIATAAPSLAFGGFPAAIGIGVYEMIMTGQRAYLVKTNGGFTRDDWRIEIEYLSAFARIVSPEERPRYMTALARAYEQESSSRSLSKALNIYTDLAEEHKGKSDSEIYQSHITRVRERIAASVQSYAKEKGDRELLEEVARDFADTKAGKEAKEFLEKGDKFEPLKKLARKVSTGGRISVSGFDLYGSGYNLFGDEERISAGVANGDAPFGDVEVPYVSRWLGGRTPALRGGPGWFSFVLNPARNKPHQDMEFFSR